MGTTGDSGDIPINSGVPCVPTRVLEAGDILGGQNPLGARRVELSPVFPLAVSVVGTRRDAVNTALSPASPLSPVENEEVRIFTLRESTT